MKFLTLIFLLFGVCVPGAFACKGTHRLLDRNCDGRTTLAFIGDSFVAGVGDRENSPQSGYVGHLRTLLPRTRILRFGTPGLTSFRLLRNIRHLGSERAGVFRKVLLADYLFIDVGRNDFFKKRNAKRTARVISLVAVGLRQIFAKNLRPLAPVFVLPMLKTQRQSQDNFLEILNENLRRRAGTSYQIGPQLDTIAVRLLGFDGLHPTHSGYIEIADMIEAFLTGDGR